MSEPTKASTLALRVLLPFAAGYFLSYLYRTVNAVLGPEVARSIELDAAALGLMTGAYFLTFAAAQLPLGLLLDRFGPRRVEAAMLLFAAAGSGVFAIAESAGVLVLGRALVGLGVSACLMAALKANVQFFPSGKLPLMNGIVLSAGGLGAVAATAPVQAALAFTDWRGVYALLGVVTVASAIFLFTTVPDHPAHSQGPSLSAQLRDIGTIVADPLFLRIAPVFMLNLGGFMAIQGLWIGPWFRDVAALDPLTSGAGLTIMAAAMAAGFLLLGIIAERLGRLGIPTMTIATTGMLLFWLCSLAMALGWTDAPLLLAAAYGFFGASASLNYAVLTQGFPAHLAGRVNTSVNLCIFATAFVLQWGLGAIIGLWPKSAGGWPPEAYRIAFLVPVVLSGLAFAWFMLAARKSRPASPDTPPSQ